MNQNRLFIPYDVAVNLRSLGFNGPCLMIYEHGAHYQGDDTYSFSVDLDYLTIQAGKHSVPADFDETTNGQVNEAYEQYDDDEYEAEPNEYPNVVSCTAPTFDQTFQWLLDTFNIFGEIRILESSSIKGNKKSGFEKMFKYEIIDLNNPSPFSGITTNIKPYYTDLYECKSDCLRTILKHLNNH